MKIITGNWYRKSDQQEIVAKVWPALENALAKQGFIYADSMSPYLISRAIRLYDSRDVELWNSQEEISPEGSDFLKEISRDLSESRSKFIRKINSFGRTELTTSRTLDNVPTRINTYMEKVELYYRCNRDLVRIEIFPKKGLSSFEYNVGIFSNRKSRDKAKRTIEKMTSASSLIVRVDGYPELEKEIKKSYREAKRNINGGGIK